MPTIETMLNDLEAGRITREAFWTGMAGHHLALRQYHALLARSPELTGIEIDAEELRVCTAGGLRFVWRPEDLRSAPNVAIDHGAYEPAESHFLTAVARTAEVVFDIGANCGWYTCHFAAGMRGAAPRLHAFEPVPATHADLARNVALNGLGDRVVLNATGFGAEAGTLTMYVPRFQGSSAASLGNLHPDDDPVEVSVAIDTLDAYAVRHGIDRLDMIKCDVEGAELFVVQGGLETIRRHRPVIFLELLRKWAKPFGYHPNEVIALLAGLGYDCWTFGADGLERLPEMTDETPQTNFVFLRPEEHGSVLTLV